VSDAARVIDDWKNTYSPDLCRRSSEYLITYWWGKLRSIDCNWGRWL